MKCNLFWGIEVWNFLMRFRKNWKSSVRHQWNLSPYSENASSSCLITSLLQLLDILYQDQGNRWVFHGFSYIYCHYSPLFHQTFKHTVQRTNHHNISRFTTQFYLAVNRYTRIHSKKNWKAANSGLLLTQRDARLKSQFAHVKKNNQFLSYRLKVYFILFIIWNYIKMTIPMWMLSSKNHKHAKSRFASC